MKVNYTLFTPGPVDVPDDVLRETSQHILYHRDASFSDMLESTQKALNTILGSSGKTYIFTSSGTGALEAACSNVLCSTDRPVVATCGKFGQRWLELCTAYRIDPITLSVEYGKSVPPDELDRVLTKQNKPTVVLTTLTETSTGALNDIRAFGEIVRAHEGFLVVDGVAGIGADECPQDDWHIDLLIGASQKALMAPAGISFLSMNERTSERVTKSDLPKYYFKFETYDKFLDRHQTPWTPAVNIIYALKKGMDKILANGISEHLRHHGEIANHVRSRVGTMGLSLLPEHPSNALTVIRMPQGIESTGIIKEIKDRFGILFANGQGELRGTILRIGHMGNYTIPKLDRALDALEKVMKQQRGKQ